MIKKDNLSLDKRSLSKFFLKLFLMQVAMLLAAIFMCGGGHGVYVQFSIFYSWLVIPVLTNYYLLPQAESITEQILTLYTLSVPLTFFLLSALLTWAIYANKIERRGLWIFILVHAIGSFVSIVFVNDFSIFTSSDHKFIFTSGVVLSFGISFFFWRFFFVFLKKVSGSYIRH